MAPPVRRPPGSTVTIVEGPQGKRGEKGEPGAPGDPTSLLDVLTPGEALTRDADGNPASLGPVVLGDATVEVYQDLAGTPDGPLTVADTGQSWVTHHSHADAASHPIVTNGLLTNSLAPGSSDPGNGYSNVQLGGDVTRIGGRYVLSPNGVLMLLVLEAPLVGAIPSMAAHLILSRTKWTIGYWVGTGDGNTGLVDIMNGYYDTPLTTDSVTPYEVEVTIDYGASRVTVCTSTPSSSPAGELSNASSVHSPDGTLHMIVSPGIAAHAGPWACFETGAVVGPLGFKEVWADAA